MGNKQSSKKDWRTQTDVQYRQRDGPRRERPFSDPTGGAGGAGGANGNFKLTKSGSIDMSGLRFHGYPKDPVSSVLFK